MNLLDEIQQEYELCTTNQILYKQKVDSISNLLRLKNNDKLIYDCPVYIVGKYEETPFILFGINPGYSDFNNPHEDKEARISWNHYLDLYKNFFLYFEKMKFESPYYTSLWYLLNGLIFNSKYPVEEKWKLFDLYLTNIELIPYHSKAISIPKILSSVQMNYLKKRFENSIEFIVKYKPKLFIFNGSLWHTILIHNKLISNHDRIIITDKFSIYFFTIKNIPCVLFDKFFQRHFWGITNEHRNKIIPNLIHDKYPNLKNSVN